MDIKLLVCLKAQRRKFYLEDYRDTDHIFALVRSGSFTVTSPAGEYTVGPLEGFLFRADTQYHRTLLSPLSMYLFRYRAEDEGFGGEQILFRDTERVRSTLDLLDSLENSGAKQDLSLHAHLLRDLMVQQKIEAFPAKEQDKRICFVLEYIRENLHQKLPLTELARLAGLSYPQFLRLFKESTDALPSDHILSLRLQKAKHLLSDTDQPIREIAAACGFENEFYFSNVFKKHTALSPTHFRRQLR